MRSRRAETLIEFIAASCIFAIVMASIFSFMATQTANTARLIDRDFFVFHAERWLNTPESKRYDTLDTERGEITFTHDDTNLIVSDGNNSMTFRFNFQ